MRIVLTISILAAVTHTLSAQTAQTGQAAQTAKTAQPAKAAQPAHPKPQGTIAGIAPPPATDANAGARRAPVVTVLPDGRVFADYGRGYEQVVRGCGPSEIAAVSGQLVAAPANGGNVQPNVAQPAPVLQPAPPRQPLPYTPPVPEQQTASQQMAQPHQVYSAAAQSCWTTDGRGQVFVVHP